MLSQLIGALAERIASDSSLPVDNRQVLRAHVVHLIEGELSRMFGGDHLRVFVPKLGADHRKARDERVAASIAAGEPPDVVARREALTPRHVRRLRGRLLGGHFRD